MQLRVLPNNNNNKIRSSKTSRFYPESFLFYRHSLDLYHGMSKIERLSFISVSFCTFCTTWQFYSLATLLSEIEGVKNYTVTILILTLILLLLLLIKQQQRVLKLMLELQKCGPLVLITYPLSTAWDVLSVTMKCSRGRVKDVCVPTNVLPLCYYISHQLFKKKKNFREGSIKNTQH